jgi:hypothetical protein
VYRVPLLQNGNDVGEMTMRQEGQETVFCCRSSLSGEGLWSLWAVGDRGELRLGMPRIEGNYVVLEKRFSLRMTEPVGRLLYGELRCPQQEESLCWNPIKEGNVFHTPWLARQLQNWPGVLWCKVGKDRMVAVPYDPKRPFPLMPMFCFASLQRIDACIYLVVRLNGEECPVF